MNRHLLMALLVITVFLGNSPQMLLAQTTLSAQARPASASQMIELNTQRILDTLNTRRDEFTRDSIALRMFVADELNAIFDRTYSARMVLGRHARGADDADITLFADALTDGLLQRYGRLLVDVEAPQGIRIKSESALPRNVGVRVSSELIRRSESPIALDYLLRQSDGQWKVFDVIIEGVSMVQTFRQQFDGQLQHASIREIAAELRAGQF